MSYHYPRLDRHRGTEQVVTGAHYVLDSAAVAGAAWAFGAPLVGASSPWWLAISWVGATGALLCWLAMALSAHRQTLRWAALCGLIAGAYAWSPLFEEITPAGVFRVMLPFALRRALRMRLDWWWYLSMPPALAALVVAPAAVMVAVMIGLLVTICQWALAHRPARFAAGLAACMALPAVVVLIELATGLRLAQIAGIASYCAVLLVVIYATITSVDLTCHRLYQEIPRCPNRPNQQISLPVSPAICFPGSPPEPVAPSR